MRLVRSHRFKFPYPKDAKLSYDTRPNSWEQKRLFTGSQAYVVVQTTHWTYSISRNSCYVSPSNPTIMAVKLVVWTQLLIQRHGSLWLCVIHCNSKLGTSCCLLFRSGWAKAVVSSISLFRRSCPIRIDSLNFYQHHGCESWALCHMMHPWKALESFNVKPPDFRHFKPNHPICCSHMQATTVQSKASHYHPIKPSRFWIIWCLQISYTWFHAESLKTKPSTILQPTNPQIPPKAHQIPAFLWLEHL